MSVSPEIQATFDYLFPLAREALTEGRSFAPFATAENLRGERYDFQAKMDVASSTPQEHILALIYKLQEHAAAGSLKAAGMIFDSVAPFSDGKTSDALCVHAETTAGESLQIFVPYERGRLPAPKFLEPVIQTAPARIFTAR